MDFTLDQAIEIANEAISSFANRRLSDNEVIVLKGAWEKKEYAVIALENHWSTAYVSKDLAYNFWNLLKKALGEENISKNNFKEALKRHWEKKYLLNKNSTTPEAISTEDHLPASNDSLEALPVMTLTKPSPDGRPLAIEKPEFSAGKLPMDSIFYVERLPIEERCYEEILKPGALLRIKAPSKFGKTSLIHRVFERVALQGYRTVRLSFRLADETHFTNLDRLLRWLCSNVSEELKLRIRFDDQWEADDLGSKVSCKKYFEKYLLPPADSPLALCLDDVNEIFHYQKVSQDFLGMLRAWYDEANIRNIWKNFRLVIVYSTDVYIPLNIYPSPFNVGSPIELPEFTNEQVQNLAKQYGLDWNASQVEQLMNMVGGHPYLVQQALDHFKNHKDMTLAQFLETATTESGIYSNHLREQLSDLQKRPELIGALKRVVTATTSVRLESIQSYQLYSRGLVKWQGNDVAPRCNLYCQYFRDRLGNT
ncbi:MAG TPA: hypothetical protein DDW76_09635 [Cyanobacteria bacterium UBA11369]|nr:hypothetical protein [Cyanobacteria bacterium UBA11371]HBE34980.1 hypothetical protein [Cyanobacteria bacterium UBA11368]HBE49036.1 hypothetical protein [Cyanobacteria bacterium UBA11369]